MARKRMVQIEVEVPEDLARRLEARRERLPEVLELGLEVLERQEEARPLTREEVLEMLRRSPLMHVSEEYAPEQVSEPPAMRLKGKPLSEIVIEDRR